MHISGFGPSPLRQTGRSSCKRRARSFVCSCYDRCRAATVARPSGSPERVRAGSRAHAAMNIGHGRPYLDPRGQPLIARGRTGGAPTQSPPLALCIAMLYTRHGDQIVAPHGAAAILRARHEEGNSAAPCGTPQAPAGGSGFRKRPSRHEPPRLAVASTLYGALVRLGQRQLADDI